MSNNASIDLVQQFNFNKKELGVVLALIEKGPTIIPKIIAQLNVPGWQDTEMWYEQAKAKLDSVP